MTDPEQLERNKQVARRFFEEIYSKRRFDLLDELVAPDYVAAGAARTVVGHDGIRRSLQARADDLTAVVEEQIAEGDKVATRVTITRHGVIQDAVVIQRFVDGRLAETWRVGRERGPE